MHEYALSFSSTSSDSSSQLSSPASPLSSYVTPLWTFLISERAAYSTHKGAILKLYKNSPTLLSLQEFHKLCDHWPKVPSSQNMQPEWKLIFISMSFFLWFMLYLTLFSCAPSTHNRHYSWSLLSPQHCLWSTPLFGLAAVGYPSHSQCPGRISDPCLWNMSLTHYSGQSQDLSFH